MTQILLKNCKKVLTADSSRGGEIGELKDFSILIEDSKISKIGKLHFYFQKCFL